MQKEQVRSAAIVAGATVSSGLTRTRTDATHIEHETCEWLDLDSNEITILTRLQMISIKFTEVNFSLLRVRISAH